MSSWSSNENTSFVYGTAQNGNPFLYMIELSNKNFSWSLTESIMFFLHTTLHTANLNGEIGGQLSV